MIKLFENGKVTVYFEDAEANKLVTLTVSDLVPDASTEEIESVVLALDELSELPMVHVIVTKSDRLLA